MWTTVKICALASIVSGIVGAGVMRSHLNSAHATERTKNDRACLMSVYKASEASRKHRNKAGKPAPRLVKMPVLVSEGNTRN
jgi:hypothetical protein